MFAIFRQILKKEIPSIQKRHDNKRMCSLYGLYTGTRKTRRNTGNTIRKTLGQINSQKGNTAIYLAKQQFENVEAAYF